MPIFDIAKWFRKIKDGRRTIPLVENHSDSIANVLRSDLERIWRTKFGAHHTHTSTQRYMPARNLVPRLESEERGTTMSINSVVNRVVSNGSLVVSNGEVWINGQQVQIGQHVKNITIEITGNVNDLQVDACNSVSVHGNVGTIRTGSGDVNVTGDVARDVQTGSGEVKVGESVGGNVTTGSGDVSATTINGAVRTASGDITGGIRHVEY